MSIRKQFEEGLEAVTEKWQNSREGLTDKLKTGVEVGFKTLSVAAPVLWGLNSAFNAREFVQSCLDYQVQAGAITQQIYSVVDVITPEVMYNAEKVVAMAVDQPDYLAAASTLIWGFVAVAWAKSAWFGE